MQSVFIIEILVVMIASLIITTLALSGFVFFCFCFIAILSFLYGTEIMIRSTINPFEQRIFPLLIFFFFAGLLGCYFSF